MVQVKFLLICCFTHTEVGGGPRMIQKENGAVCVEAGFMGTGILVPRDEFSREEERSRGRRKRE